MTRSPHHPERSRAGLRTALSVALATLIIAVAAALGVLVVDLGSDRGADPALPTPTPTPSLPMVDVAGEEPPGLARYPGAVRIAYVREQQGGTTVTGIEYVADAELDEVRAHYRRIFREEGWELIELDFAGGDWVFLVERGSRVALVEIESRDPVVGIEVELAEPAAPATISPTPRPTPQPPPPPPGDDDDDD